MSGILKKTIIILTSLFFISWLIATIISSFSQTSNYGNVALIPIKGMITSDGENIFSTATTSASSIVEKLDQIKKDKAINAVIFEINSPGGGPVASEEIAKAIEELNKTTVAWVREVAASGAYWVAAGTDKIFASRISILGSVGVLSSNLGFSEFLEEHNVSYNRLVAGEYKDLASPLKKMSEEEKNLLQEKIDLIHEYFLNEIIRLRNIDEILRKEIGSAMIYTGMESLELGLIDEIGTKKDVVEYLEEELNTTITIKSYEDKKSFLELLSGLFSSREFQIKSFLNEKNNVIST
ncbi:signal peptide peptidase SppA [Candidatus Woesearchaeota archaeon]|jgi:protease-4|nr:signal peptide peptidase SppA [Candidatus Woesearchaeota archaeon]|tara:strand:+ start:144 stop:1028 length:885 start_codon:yes stop_codon:yes gene_type:complete